MKKKKAICYYRVSSEQQAKKQSINMQKLRLKKFADEKNYEIVAEFEDEAISGESIESRPGFKNALETIKEGGVDVLLVYMIDRIGRFAVRKDRNDVIEVLENSRTNVDSPYHGLFRWDNEKEVNNLEGALNESRLENKMRGIRISEGHTTKRLDGRYSGGLLPYGVKFEKKLGTFHEVPEEVDTLEVILQKITAGWGLGRVRDYLNDNPDLYPKRKRKFRGELITKWSAENIRLLILNDFYFTGVVPRTEKSKAKGIPAMKTGIKLFNEDTVKIARREMSGRRTRFIDPGYQGRKRTHSQQDKTVFTDALLHKIARCGKCGWNLGLQPMHKGKYNYLYYKCKGRDKGRCDFRNVRAEVLDRNVWSEFVKMLSNPQKVKKMILEQNFIMDKNLEEKKAEHRKAGKDFEKAKEAIERTKKQYRWGDLTDNEYQAEMANLRKILSQAEERTKNLGQIVNRPKDVHEAVAKSTKYLANELRKVETVKEIRLILKNKGMRFKRRLRFPELLNDPEYSKLLDKLQSADDMADRLELAGDDIETLIFQQKRAMLQKFIDPAEDKGIRVYSANKFDLFFYVHLDLFDDSGYKKRENK